MGSMLRHTIKTPGTAQWKHKCSKHLLVTVRSFLPPGQTFTGCSFSNVSICCFSLSYLRIHWEDLWDLVSSCFHTFFNALRNLVLDQMIKLGLLNKNLQNPVHLTHGVFFIERNPTYWLWHIAAFSWNTVCHEMSDGRDGRIERRRKGQ